jgi:restriction system protein
VSDDEIAERLEAARDRLAAARLLEPGGGARFRLSALGRRVLDENPDGVDESVLAHYVETLRFAARPDEPPPGDAAPAAPERGSSAPRRQREYEEGVNAFREGREISANPYPLQTDQHQAWEAGWCEARDEAFGPTALGG